MTIYRKVMCSDRLPEKEGTYDTAKGSLYYIPRVDVWSPILVEFWLEEIQLPNEEDKQVIVKEAWKKQDVDPSSFMVGFNKAIEIIKGGTK